MDGLRGQQVDPPLVQPAVVGVADPNVNVNVDINARDRDAKDAAGPAVKPLNDGPLHEAFLSPAKDRQSDRVTNPPPPPIVERPGVDPPSPRSEWIGGYWEWDQGPK